MKRALGIRSPSRVFAELGMYTGLGFEEGLTDSLEHAGQSAQSTLDKQMRGVAATAQGSLSKVNATATLATSPSNGNAGAGVTQHITVNYPVAEPTSITTNRALQYASAIGEV